MKTLQLNPKNFPTRSAMLLILLMSVTTILSQNKSDSTKYLPQISFEATNGLGPYIQGSKQENMFMVYDLPDQTTKVFFSFIDVDGNQVGTSYTEEGSSLTSALWYVELDTFNLPLSPQLDIRLTYGQDSSATYKIPYRVYPDTLIFKATEGWGSFITNNYQFTDTSWHPVPELLNTFTVTNLPLRTDTLKFEILTADSTVVDSLWVTASLGEHLDSAVFANVRMDNLPLSTRYLRALIWCNGGPRDGLSYHKDLTIIPQKPKLICKSEGITLHDSIGVFTQNQIAGNALSVDSVKYAVITNGPGLVPTYLVENGFQGPYSLDLINGTFSIEAWLKMDLNKLWNNQGNIDMYFMLVDSVWAIYVHSYWDQIVFEISSLAGGNEYWIYGFKTGFDQYHDSDWHHIAFTFNGQSNPLEYAFYLDGEYVWCEFSQENYNYVKYNTNYDSYFLTKHLIMGGCLSYLVPNTPDYSFITAMDEVRIWNRALSGEEIKTNYKKTVLQDPSLVGYWNFNDLRNRLGTISDISYKNNSGQLKNGATFIPQYPQLQITLDTIGVTSSNALTDSIVFSFIDANNQIVDSDTLLSNNGNGTLIYDISSLPYEISHLRISEYFPGAADTGFITKYNLNGWAPPPIATPFYNWNTYYHTPESFGSLNNPITVSNFPENTEKVILGLCDENNFYDTAGYTKSSVPYEYSLTLNGTDNYIETSQKVLSPSNFTIDLWFRTTTKEGGKIIGFTENQNGIANEYYDRGLYMETDGSLKFRIDIMGAIRYLYGSNIYNNGVWHHVTVFVDGNNYSALYIDGCMVDFLPAYGTFNYEGYWVIGRNNSSQKSGQKAISEFFQGSLCEIKIEHSSKDFSDSENTRFQSKKSGNGGLYYKLDEGTGTVINDSQGNNNGEIKGSPPRWSHSNKLSTVVWNNNMVNKQPGVYTFFARVFYPGGPDTGLTYPLGRYLIKDPFPGEIFYYNLMEGLGYFNEGTHNINALHYYCGYTYQGQYNWKDNFFKLRFLSPDHRLIHDSTITFTSNSDMGWIWTDVGEAPPGSYLHFQFGYHTNDNAEVCMNKFSIPIYIRPMIPPIVAGDFGPFDQAIAPGVMQRENTFVITTEVLSDLKKVKGKFYTDRNEEIGSVDAEKINETTWHLTYDMSTLAPPVTLLNFEYYLGEEEFLALVQGPFKITIHQTRPKWFDFIPNSDFHNIVQNGEIVTFDITTTISQNYLFDNTLLVEIPAGIPIIGETFSKLKAPTAEVYLKYTIPEYNLELTKAPEFYNSIVNLGGGDENVLNFQFNTAQYNSYYLDEHSNLFATQNFATDGSLSSKLTQVEDLIEKVVELLNDASDINPEEFIIAPDFSIDFTGGFNYSSRLHLTIDTLTGKWGSVGNLHVDANSQHEEAFKNSASFHFYSGAMGVDFGVGVKIFDGFFNVDFVTDMRFDLGFGQSYINLPFYKNRFLKSFAFQIYGKIVTKELWGWFEQTVWGPELFYSNILWGDDMTDAFPTPEKNKLLVKSIPVNSSWPELSKEIKPVSLYSKMPQAYPEQSIVFSEDCKLFTWLEKGNSYGERALVASYISDSTEKFSEKITLTTNFHAINHPVVDILGGKIMIAIWAQTRHTNETILEVKSLDVLNEFAQTQDIWYAFYDLETATFIQMGMIDDDSSAIISGRAEGNPEITVISDNCALITWQVVDFEDHKSDIWYVLFEKQGGIWVASNPAVVAEIDGIETYLEIKSPEEDFAVMVWMNTNTDSRQNRLMTTIFNGAEWSAPDELVAPVENYHYNYLDMAFSNEFGAVVWTTFVDDTAYNHYETLSLLPWDPVQDQWSGASPIVLMTDSINHLQLPEITVDGDGNTVIACKVEQFISKTGETKISQVDLLVGDLNYPYSPWNHIVANEFVCDTTKQVADLEISFIGQDTLMILSHEYVMLPTSSPFEPKNGIIFGDPYMNLVLRSFCIDDQGTVEDINEYDYFLGIEDDFDYSSDVRLYQNFPNPCLGSTTIQFYIPHDTPVKLELFDMNGVRSAVLVDNKLLPGMYEINLNTIVLKPGPYIYKLTTDDAVRTLKMMVGM
ncbi:MAG: T9SS type A sorting domain-containing protein [Bacteroidales bacterium]|nr:T9SS type A sorting domain-containing protein [Bacteroidales bacterium]